MPTNTAHTGGQAIDSQTERLLVVNTRGGVSPKVMAAVLNFDSPDNLLDVLAGLVERTVRPDKILVVDNASRQPVAKLLSDRFDSDGIA